MSLRIKSKASLLMLPLLMAVSNLLAQQGEPKAEASREVVKYLDRLQTIIKRNAAVADSIDWQQLNTEVREKAQGMVTITECKPVLEHILSTLRSAGDKHSVFLPKGKAIPETAASYAGQQAQILTLGNGVGYIKIPTLGSMSPPVRLVFSQEIRRQLVNLLSQHAITSWIVDLRQNRGGDLEAMLAGVEVLFGRQPYGYVIYPGRRQEMPIRSKSNEGRHGKLEAAPTSDKVAVLIDAQTERSGEIIAICLKGLDNAKLFGQASGGYTTTNQTFMLSDGTALLLATGYMADKDRNPYLAGIMPDVVVGFSADDVQDKLIHSARQWLEEVE